MRPGCNLAACVFVMTAVLQPVDVMSRDRIMASLDDNAIKYGSSPPSPCVPVDLLISATPPHPTTGKPSSSKQMNCSQKPNSSSRNFTFPARSSRWSSKPSSSAPRECSRTSESRSNVLNKRETTGKCVLSSRPLIFVLTPVFSVQIHVPADNT